MLLLMQRVSAAVAAETRRKWEEEARRRQRSVAAHASRLADWTLRLTEVLPVGVDGETCREHLSTKKPRRVRAVLWPLASLPLRSTTTAFFPCVASMGSCAVEEPALLSCAPALAPDHPPRRTRDSCHERLPASVSLSRRTATFC